MDARPEMKVFPPGTETEDWLDVLDRLEAFAAKPGLDEQHRRDLEYAVELIWDLVASERALLMEAADRMQPALDRRHPETEEINREIAKLFKQGVKVNEIAQLLKLTKNAVKKRIQRMRRR
jgi:DNA-binding NarL/FixJ family response regulator